MHGAFADDEVIHRSSEAWFNLYNIRCKMHHLIAREVYKGYLDLTHLAGDKGAIRSTPRLWSSPPNNPRMFLEAPFFMKRRSPLDPESSSTLSYS